MTTPSWKMTLKDYLGPAPLVEDYHETHHVHAAAMARLLRLDAEASDWPEADLPARPDLEVRMDSPSAWVVRDRATSALLGGQTLLIPIVVPGQRSRGIASEMHVLVDEMGARRWAMTYSKAGLMARVRAHRLHVERALVRGETVPDEVLADYASDASGRLALRAPWTPERHAEWIVEARERERLATFARVTDGMAEILHGPHDLDERHFVEFGPRGDGHALAACLAIDAGAEIRVGLREGSVLFVQAAIGDVVVDVFGARPEALAQDELVRRNILSDPNAPPDPFFGLSKLQSLPIEIARHPDAAAFEAWAGPGREDAPGEHLAPLSPGLLAEARATQGYDRLLEMARRIAAEAFAPAP